MSTYIIRRLAVIPPVLVLLSFILFALVALAPGDQLDMIFMDNPHITPDAVQALRDYYRLDDPVHQQYWNWASAILLEGNWGTSLTYAVPVNRILRYRIWNTLQLTILALLVSLGLAIPIGLISAVRQYSAFDHVCTFLAFVGRSMPRFWFGMLLIMVFAVTLGWLPVTGMRTAGADFQGWAVIADRLRHIIMPVAVLAMTQVANWSRYVRSGLLDVLSKDFIRTARSKGLSERTVLYKHALRNALIPLVTMIALSIPAIVGGSVLTETIFSWPGVGKTLYDSILASDINLTLFTLLLLSALTLFANLLADISYVIIDPRVTYD